MGSKPGRSFFPKPKKVYDLEIFANQAFFPCRVISEHVIISASERRFAYETKPISEATNHGSATEERRSEGIVLCLVSRRARGERAERRTSVDFDDSAFD